jgi:hypothetical protein
MTVPGEQAPRRRFSIGRFAAALGLIAVGQALVSAVCLLIGSFLARWLGYQELAALGPIALTLLVGFVIVLVAAVEVMVWAIRRSWPDAAWGAAAGLLVAPCSSGLYFAASSYFR